MAFGKEEVRTYGTFDTTDNIGTTARKTQAHRAGRRQPDKPSRSRATRAIRNPP